MKKLTILLMIFVQIVSLNAQNLDKMSEAKRNDTLLKIAKKNVLKYGPDFYREYGKPEISREIVTDSNPRFSDEDAKKHKNRSYYTVKYFYDKTQEAFRDGYSAWVFIWGDTGKVIKIAFGNGLGLTVETIENSTRKSPNGFTKMNWQKQPPGSLNPYKPIRIVHEDTTRKVN